jgi:ubiquinone/menaquinone biosynthesis C-methylase UbiE
VRWLLKLWRVLPERSQVLIIQAVQRNKRLYRWSLFHYIGTKDRANTRHANLPPVSLRYRVSCSPDAEEFIATGKTCAADIQSALVKVGRDLGSFTRILDFGCGCGRTLVHLKNLAPTAQINGADIDTKAIEWCRLNLKFGSYDSSNAKPPLAYHAATFDFIYAISVFTHLDEHYQFLWLQELERIAKPGAIVLLTVDSSLAGDQGFTFRRSYEKGIFPAWYQNAYHSKEYVLASFGTHFEVLDYFPRAMNSHQDVVVLEKSNDIQSHAFG